MVSNVIISAADDLKMILEVVAVTTIHHKMSVKVHLWEISWDEAVYFPHCNPSDGYLFAQTTFTQIIYHGTLQLRGCAGGWYLSSAVSPLSGLENRSLQYLPASCCPLCLLHALHHRSYETQLSEGVLRSVETDVPDIYLAFHTEPGDSGSWSAEARCRQHVAENPTSSLSDSLRRNFFKNTWSFHKFLNAVNRICGRIKC